MTAKRILIATDSDFKVPPITFLQWYYGLLVDRYGKDSFQARFYLKYADSWYPTSWTDEQLEKELTRPSKNWSRKTLEAFASTVSKE